MQCPPECEGFIYEVHPSYKSQTAVRIIRRLAPLPTNLRPVPDNPYVYKPKSYSRKRTQPQQIPMPYTDPLPSKKVKKNEQTAQNHNHENLLDEKYIRAQLKEPANNFFDESFFENTKKEAEIICRFPLEGKASGKIRGNPQLSHKIQIVSTDNHKILIPIHQGLLKANTNHSKQEQSLDGIVNPFNSVLKEHYTSMIPFVKQYKSGYTPIEMQNRSKKEDQGPGGYDEPVKTGPKSHFIKKKQSTLSLSRTCGVSYIRPSQSVQGPPYEPLPPLIFQCSTSCNYTPQLRELYHTHISELITLSQNRWFPVILTTEEHMRELLQGKPHGKAIWVNGLHNLWPLFNEGNFLLIMFKEEWAGTEEQVWQQFNTCDFKFGILAKKSTSGKKMFLKSIQLDGEKDDHQSVVSHETALQKITSIKVEEMSNGIPVNEVSRIGSINQMVEHEEKKMEDSQSEEKKQCKDVCEQFMRELKNTTKVVTMSLKFEMYVHESFWKACSHQQKNLLNAIIHSFEEHLQKKALEVIKDRLELAKGIGREELLSKALSKLRVGGHLGEFNPLPIYKHDSSNKFTLSTIISLNNALEIRQNPLPGHPFGIADIVKDKLGHQNSNLWQKALKMPIYYISTRDSFAFDLVEKITYFKRGDHNYTKIEYLFEPDNLPANYTEYKKLFPDLRVGVTCYHNFFTEKELQYFETQTMATERSAFKNNFLQMTVQPTIVGNRIKRTKFFFGYRYMWTRCQLAQPQSYVGAGVRRDVTPPPKWLADVQNPMVENGILQPNFINSVAINVYHDGSEGLAQHFDDATRFKQPIYTLRLVSDGRLSFGSQFYGFCNGAFIIPLPRGCICMLEENSYAANGVKHCVRPCDMSGKSAAVILRQMHHQVVREATKYDELIDFPAWLSTLSQDPKAITFAEQKRREAEHILAEQDRKKQKEREKTKIAIETK